MNSRQLLALVGLLGMTFFVYFPTLNHGFINYDDGAYVYENPYVVTGLTWDNLIWAFSYKSCEASGNWHPLTWISMMSDVSIWGLVPQKMHAVNMAIHTANVFLLMALLYQGTKAFWPSYFVAAMFAVHPLHIESVAWISERKDLLSTFFVFCAIYCYMKWMDRKCYRWQIASLICYTLSLLSKQMYVTLPFLLILIDIWPLMSKAGSLEQSVSSLIKTLGRQGYEKFPYFCLAILFSVIAYLGQQYIGAVGSIEEYAIGERILNAIVTYSLYIGKTIWPFNLAVFYPYPEQVSRSAAVASAILLLIITTVAIRLRKDHPWFLIGWFWYIGTLVPVIGLIQIGKQRMADRYMYFPMIGLLLAATWMTVRWAANKPVRQEVSRALAGIAVLGCLFASRIQIANWKDSMTLFTHAEKVAESSLAHTKVGYEYAQLGNLDVAEGHFRRALELNPQYVSAHLSLGNTYLAKRSPQVALKHFRTVIKLRPEHAEAHYNLGITFQFLGDLESSEKHYKKALELAPDNMSAQTNLGIVCLDLKKYPEALTHLQRVVSSNPNSVQANFALGRLFTETGQHKKAIDHLKSVIKADPSAGEAHFRLAELYKHQGNTGLANKHFKLANELESKRERGIKKAN